MGTNMRPTIFNDRVAAALKNWHHTAKKHTKHNKHSESTTPFSSRPATPTHGMSPVHLLHNYPRSVESYHASPRHSNFDNDHLGDPADSFRSPRHHEINDQFASQIEMREVDMTTGQEPAGSSQVVPDPQTIRTQHEIDISQSNFSFGKKWWAKADRFTWTALVTSDNVHMFCTCCDIEACLHGNKYRVKVVGNQWNKRAQRLESFFLILYSILYLFFFFFFLIQL